MSNMGWLLLLPSLWLFLMAAITDTDGIPSALVFRFLPLVFGLINMFVCCKLLGWLN